MFVYILSCILFIRLFKRHSVVLFCSHSSSQCLLLVCRENGVHFYFCPSLNVIRCLLFCFCLFYFIVTLPELLFLFICFFFAFSLLLPRSFLFLSLPVCIFTCLYLRVNCVRFRVIWCNASNPVDMMLLRLNHIARFSFHKCFYLAMHLIVWSGF